VLGGSARSPTLEGNYCVTSASLDNARSSQSAFMARPNIKVGRGGTAFG